MWREASLGPDHKPPFMLTAEEVAEQFLRTSKKAVYEMVRRGRIPAARKIGRRLLFRRDVLVKWIEASNGYARVEASNSPAREKDAA
jgi:excisionase family DNA binding protein